MFNTINYDELLNRALKRVETGIDTSEGSFLFDAIAPCVAELYEAYLYIDKLEKRIFADTAYGEYLDRRCAERGIYLINYSASLVIPYLGGSNVVVFTNMSSSTSYSSIVYGFEVIEYY